MRAKLETAMTSVILMVMVLGVLCSILEYGR